MTENSFNLNFHSIIVRGQWQESTDAVLFRSEHQRTANLKSMWIIAENCVDSIFVPICWVSKNMLKGQIGQNQKSQELKLQIYEILPWNRHYCDKITNKHIRGTIYDMTEMACGELSTDSKMSKMLQYHTPRCFKYVDCCLSNLCLWRIFCCLVSFIWHQEFSWDLHLQCFMHNLNRELFCFKAVFFHRELC